jgi:predicted PurR-regulated permease PerM
MGRQPARPAGGRGSRNGDRAVSDDVPLVEPPMPPASATDELAAAPPWLEPMMRRLLWWAIGVLAVVGVLLLLVLKLRGLLSILVIALFLAVAMEPAVTWLHVRHRISRGAATGLVFLAVAGFVLATLFVLIPGIGTAADAMGTRLPGLLDEIRTTFGITIGNASTGEAAAVELQESVRAWLHDRTPQLLGLASNAVGVVFQLLTIASFTFYFAAGAPAIRRAVLTRLPPARQHRLGWALDTAIQQTGGYFYSRLILMLINGGLAFIVFVVVGMPWLVSLPLAIFQAFFAEFIPVVGTYIGAAIPVIVTLGLRGLVPALIVIAWVVVYQQLENVWLSPRLSARTMDINGAVAFGAAIAGGAIAGPIGAFMALPVAALITSFVRHYGRSYPLTYHSAYDGDTAAVSATTPAPPTD